MTTYDYDLTAAREELDGLVAPTTTGDSRELPAGAWGRHVRINLAGCDYDVISDTDAVRDIIRHLVDEIGMRPFGEPISVMFGQGALFGNTGIQLGTNSQTHQLIETSNISVHCNHTVPELTAFVDIFSCAEFNPESAVAFITKAFGARKVSFTNDLRIAPPLDD